MLSLIIILQTAPLNLRVLLLVFFRKINSLKDLSLIPAAVSDPHLTSVVQNAEHQFVFVLFGFGEFHVTGVSVQQLVHEGKVGGFGEPALLVQQGQDAWRVVLQDSEEHRGKENIYCLLVK